MSIDPSHILVQIWLSSEYMCMATSSKCNGNSTTHSTGPQSPPKLLQQQSFITNSFIHNNYNYQYLHHQSFPPAKQNQMMIKMMEERKRGLSRTQIDWLERSFQEGEGKPLEPERKLKLSQDLGLHPRQVSVWFQNRRARWKNKQLQQLYHSLQQENQNLRYEVMALRAKLGHLEMEKQKAAQSDNRYMEAPFIIKQATGESKSSVINNQSSNNRIMLQDDHDAHYKQLELLAEDRWLHI